MDKGEQLKPEFKKYSFENWGQLLKVSASLSPEMFPEIVSIPLQSKFMQDMLIRILAGPGGRLIEHSAVLGVNDLGELLIGGEIFEGNNRESLTEESGPKFFKYLNSLKSVPLPPGWRTIGMIHSHPLVDVSNQIIDVLIFSDTPKVKKIPISLSGQDYRSFLIAAKTGHHGLTTMGMINTTQVVFMVATESTIKLLKSPTPLMKEILASKSVYPQYDTLEKLGLFSMLGITWADGKAICDWRD